MPFKIISALILLGIFLLVVFTVPYPNTISSANSFQLLTFFIPLFLFMVLTIGVFLKNIYISGSLSLGLIFLLILKSLDSLNLVTAILIIITIYLLVSSFRRAKRGSLTKWPKIPKITKLRR